jgi:DNA-3-methyladenine glycosylase I
MLAYHDREWGVPVHDDGKLFEFLVLDAFQAGLSWRTILHKRENFRAAFAGFQADRVARFDRRRIERLMGDAGIVRNRQKIEATVANARAVLEVQEKYGSLDRFLWELATPRAARRFRSLRQIPAQTAVSKTMSKALLAHGFAFVGPTICYAFMQAAGMVNDHLVNCFRHPHVEKLQERASG